MSGHTGEASAVLWPPGHPSRSCVALHSAYFDLEQEDFVEQVAPLVAVAVTSDTAFAATLAQLSSSSGGGGTPISSSSFGLGDDGDVHGEGGFRLRQWYSSVSGSRGASPTCWRGGMQESPISPPANNGQFWFRALRERASAHRALLAATQDGYRLFLELNSGAVACEWATGVCRSAGGDVRSVSGGCSSHSGRSRSVALPALGGGNTPLSDFDPMRSAGDQILSSLANLFVSGCNVDWARAYRRMATGPQTLPTEDLIQVIMSLTR